MCRLSVDFNSLVIVTAAAKTPSWALDSAPLLCVAYDVMTTAFVSSFLGRLSPARSI